MFQNNHVLFLTTMKKFTPIFILLYVVAHSALYSQSSIDLENVVATLSSEEMAGRRAGSFGEKKAAYFITSQLGKLGIQTISEGYLHPFGFNDISFNKKNEKSVKNIKTAHNIIGFIDNKKERTIVLGAHYDHLGKGFHINSRSTEIEPIHYGADDNASGVASVLQLASQLNSNEITEGFNFMIVFFSAEEIGLLGSKALLETDLQRFNLAAMINLDMVGRMKEDKVQIYGIGTSDSWNSFTSSTKSIFEWEIDSSGLGPSDHASFYLDSIPAIHLFTGQHEDYHKETDTHDKLNYKGMASISNWIYDYLVHLETTEEFSFKATKNKTTKKRPSLKVTMGIMPSYVSNDLGLKIDGVIDGKPAQKARMRKNDVITKIGQSKIKDIYDYMGVLSIYNPGDKTTVTVLRNNKTITLNIQF